MYRGLFLKLAQYLCSGPWVSRWEPRRADWYSCQGVSRGPNTVSFVINCYLLVLFLELCVWLNCGVLWSICDLCHRFVVTHRLCCSILSTISSSSYILKILEEKSTGFWRGDDSCILYIRESRASCHRGLIRDTLVLSLNLSSSDLFYLFLYLFLYLFFFNVGYKHLELGMSVYIDSLNQSLIKLII